MPELLTLICEKLGVFDIARWALTHSAWATRLAPFWFHMHQMVSRAWSDLDSVASFDELVALLNSNPRWVKWNTEPTIYVFGGALNLVNSWRSEAGFVAAAVYLSDISDCMTAAGDACPEVMRRIPFLYRDKSAQKIGVCTKVVRPPESQCLVTSHPNRRNQRISQR